MNELRDRHYRVGATAHCRESLRIDYSEAVGRIGQFRVDTGPRKGVLRRAAV